MQRTRNRNPQAAGQRKNNFFQKPRNTPDQIKPEPKSTRASEATGNEFFMKPSVASQKLQDTETTRKPFDKKSWRLQKYSKKYKLDQWENRRKSTVLREYYRQIDPNEKKLDVEKIYQQYDEEESNPEITAEENDNDNNSNADNNPTTSIIDNSSSKSDNNEGNKKRISKGKNAFEKARNQLAKMKGEKRNNNSNADNNPIIDNNDRSAEASNKRMSKGKNAFQKARNQLAKMKDEKRLKKEEFLKKKEEKEEKLKLYKQKRDEKFKRLNKKTKRGQPVMKDRLEMLLEQIQNNM